MKLTVAGLLAGTVMALLLLLACAPRSGPTPPTTPAAQPPPPAPVAIAPRVATTLSPQETALSSLVEAAKKEGKLTAYSFGFTGDIGLALIRAFNDKYGITLNIITGRGAEMLERIRTEGRTGSIVADFMETSATNNMNLKIAGLTVSSKDLPVFQEKEVWRVDPLINDPEGHLLGHRAMLLPAWYNTRQLKAEEVPKSYRELTQARWRGKFALPDGAISSGSYDLLMTLERQGFLHLDIIKAIGRNEPWIVAGTRQVAEAVARGEVPLGMPSSDNDVGPFLKEGAPVRPVDVQEGTIAQSSTMARVKGGPHPSATLLFMNWMFTKEGQAIYTQSAALSSVRKDVPDARPEAGRLNPSRLVMMTNEDAVRNAQLLREKFLVNLWKQ